MVISDGQPVEAATDNAAFVSKTANDVKVGKLGLKHTGVESGPDLFDNVQRVLNRLDTAAGVTENTMDGTTYGAPANTIVDGDNHPTALTKLADKFHPSTGHSHNGTDGQGPQLLAAAIGSVPLRGYVQQGTDLIAVTGTSKDVSTELTGKSPSSGPSGEGVVVTAPDNKVILRHASGSSQDDPFEDGSGNHVYGRLTESAGVWTLSFYVNLSGTETAYNFTSSEDIRWYYQELFNPLGGFAPVYSEFAAIPSDNATADVIDATTALFGKVRLASDFSVNNNVVTATLLKQLLGTGIAVETPFTIANNQASPADVTGLVFDKDVHAEVRIDYTLWRADATEGRRQSGRLILHYNYFTSSWTINDTVFSSSGNLSGVVFSVTAGGQIRYTSDDMTGGSYFAKLTHKVTETFNKEV